MSNCAAQLRLVASGYADHYSAFADGQNLGEVVNAAVAPTTRGITPDDSISWYTISEDKVETPFNLSVATEGSDSAVLFHCGCGEWGCSNIRARVRVDGSSIISILFRVALSIALNILFSRGATNRIA